MCHEGRNVGKWEQNNISSPLICTTYMDAYISQLLGTDTSRTCCIVLCLKKNIQPHKRSHHELAMNISGSVLAPCRNVATSESAKWTAIHATIKSLVRNDKELNVSMILDKLDKPILYNSIFLLKLRKSSLSMKFNYCELWTHTFHLIAGLTHIHSYSKSYKQNIMQQNNRRLQDFFHNTRFDN